MKKFFVFSVLIVLFVFLTGCEENTTQPDLAGGDVNIPPQDRAPRVMSFSVSPSFGTVPLTVDVAANAVDPDAGSISYFWEFGNGDGSSKRTATTIFTEVGLYNIFFTATDSSGNQALRSAAVWVSEPAQPGNSDPGITSFSASPTQGEAPLMVNFSVSASDPDGDPLNYRWDFGDGNTGNGNTPSHHYTDPGLYTAQVTITDGKGGIITRTSAILADEQPVEGNQPPQIQAINVSPQSGLSPLEVNVEVTASDPGDTLFYTINFGNGNSAISDTAINVYQNPGLYNIQVVVMDGRGGSDYGSVAVNVMEEEEPENLAPVAIGYAILNSLTAPAEVIWKGELSYDPEGDELSFRWTTESGQVLSNSENFSETLNEPGQYTRILEVRDSEGLSSRAVAQVTVAEENGPVNLPPVAVAFGIADGPAPTLIRWQGGYSYDPEGSPLSYEWKDLDGNVVSTSANFNENVEEAGIYIRILEVRDSEGLSSRAVAQVTVNPDPPTVTVLWEGDKAVTVSHQTKTVGTFDLGGADSVVVTLKYSGDSQLNEDCEFSMENSQGNIIWSGVIHDPGNNFSGMMDVTIFRNTPGSPGDIMTLVMHYRGPSPSPSANSTHVRRVVRYN